MRSILLKAKKRKTNICSEIKSLFFGDESCQQRGEQEERSSRSSCSCSIRSTTGVNMQLIRRNSNPFIRFIIGVFLGIERQRHPVGFSASPVDVRSEVEILVFDPRVFHHVAVAVGICIANMSGSGRIIRTCDACCESYQNLCCVTLKRCPFLAMLRGHLSCRSGITKGLQIL